MSCSRFALDSGTELTAERTRPALGPAHEADCPASAHRLTNGDGVLLYTDGLIEARGEQTRVRDSSIVRDTREGAQLAPDTLEVLKRDLQEFAGERLADDVSLLVLRG